MKRLALTLVPAVLVALVPAASAAAAPADRPGQRHGAPVLLSLGDSVAAGFAVPEGSGYPEQLQDLLAAGYHPAAGKATPHKRSAIELVNLADSGDTTTALVHDQLPAALRLIESRRDDRDPKNDVEVVTVTIGGNDVFRPVTTVCLSPMALVRAQCQATVDTQLSQVRAGLTTTLSALTAAAGRRTEVVVTTYYDPIGSCFLAALAPVSVPLAEVVLEGGTLPGLLTLQAGLNTVIEQTAAATGAQVADLHGTLDRTELVGGADCLHPNTAGHADIAATVYGRLAR